MMTTHLLGRDFTRDRFPKHLLYRDGNFLQNERSNGTSMHIPPQQFYFIFHALNLAATSVEIHGTATRVIQ